MAKESKPVKLTVGDAEITVTEAADEVKEEPVTDNPFVIEGEKERLAAARQTYRDVLKWVVTAFASVGTLLVGGLSISAIGDLKGDEWTDAIVAIAVIVLGVGLVVVIAGRALSPLMLDYKSIKGTPTIGTLAHAVKHQFEEHPSLLDDFTSFDTFYESYTTEDDDKHQGALQLSDGRIGSFVLFFAERSRFNRALACIVVGAALVAGGAVGFASALDTPPKEPADAPTALSQGTPVAIDLTDDGEELLNDNLAAGCLAEPLEAIATSGSESDGYDVVVLPPAGCEPIKLFLAPSLGTVRALCPVSLPSTSSSTTNTSTSTTSSPPVRRDHSLCIGI
jgi:hypothetical protein